MLRFLVLTSLAALVLAEPVPQPRYLEDRLERVVGGEVARPSSWPWQVALQYSVLDFVFHICGGTLIARGWVMTAAHCLLLDRRVETSFTLRKPGKMDLRDRMIIPRDYHVVLGEHDLNSFSGRKQIIGVSKVHIHPQWKKLADGYDIALLQLASEATLNSYVQLGSLPPSGQILPHNNLCYITGWGLTSIPPLAGGRLSNYLKQAFLPVVDHETCSRGDWWGSTVKTAMVCGGGGGTEAGCYGDSGSPLNCLVGGKYYVHGSFVSAFGCNVPKKPTVFTRVSAYVEWMSSIIV
ncbi:elastase-1-like [Pagrus major]|uniref:elastase-1-like n=1 Tax=Pagrus major TaxID=143350 RepID=UPI003CC8CC19